MKILGLDFETQGVDAKTTRITEAGAILYHYESGSQWPLREICRLSQICWEPDYPPQDPFVVELTGLTDELLKAEGVPRKAMLLELLDIYDEADIVFAHNENFDRTVLQSTARLYGGHELEEKEWICTLRNFPWPAKYTCHKLSHLAYEHSILVDPSTLHRAVNDVELMMQLIASKYNLDDVISYARKPWVYLKADCLPPWVGRGGDGGTQVGIARTLGFSFEQVRGDELRKWPKSWVTRVKPDRVEFIKETVRNSASPFRVAQIEGV